MPSNKFKTRFPPARIKKIMQTDEEVGKVAAAVPVIVSKSVELFTEILLQKSGEIALSRGARTLSIDHIRQCVEEQTKFDFLRELVQEAAAKAVGKSGDDPPSTGSASSEAGSSGGIPGTPNRTMPSTSSLSSTARESVKPFGRRKGRPKVLSSDEEDERVVHGSAIMKKERNGQPSERIHSVIQPPALSPLDFSLKRASGSAPSTPTKRSLNHNSFKQEAEPFHHPIPSGSSPAVQHRSYPSSPRLDTTAPSGSGSSTVFPHRPFGPGTTQAPFSPFPSATFPHQNPFGFLAPGGMGSQPQSPVGPAGARRSPNVYHSPSDFPGASSSPHAYNAYGSVDPRRRQNEGDLTSPMNRFGFFLRAPYENSEGE